MSRTGIILTLAVLILQVFIATAEKEVQFQDNLLKGTIDEDRESIQQLSLNLLEEETQQQQHALFRGGSKDSCSDIGDCHECTFTSHCHWCQHDQQCHTIGSPYGCVTSTGCGGEPDPKPTPPDSCSQYPNCVACGNTHTCHWCAHDEACHTIGSFYGCVRGTECYANDRCRRKTPEPLPPPQQTFTNMGMFMVILVGLGSFLAFCAASFCFCCFCGVKGAYQDLLLFGRGRRRRRRQARRNQAVESNDVQEDSPTGESPAAASIESDRELIHQEEETRKESEAGDASSIPNEANVEGGENIGDQFHPTMEMEREAAAGEEQQQERSPLLPRSPESIDELDNPAEEPESPHMGRMHRMCTCLYFFFVIALGGITFMAIRFYPKIPEYSVCNDSVAWTRLFESLATLKTEVDFEILMSFENSNHLGVALDGGHGIFKYSGQPIGHYRIPPVNASAMAITDILIVATLTPTTWEVMHLSKDYYEGTLVLDIDVHLDMKWLFNMTMPISVQDKPVEINRSQDRHLCKCKKWDGGRNSTLGHHADLLDWFPSVSGSNV